MNSESDDEMTIPLSNTNNDLDNEENILILYRKRSFNISIINLITTILYFFTNNQYLCILSIFTSFISLCIIYKFDYHLIEIIFYTSIIFTLWKIIVIFINITHLFKFLFLTLQTIIQVLTLITLHNFKLKLSESHNIIDNIRGTRMNDLWFK